MTKKIKVTFPGNVYKEVDSGTTTQDLIGNRKEPGDPIAAIIDGRLVELSEPLYENSNITPINLIHRAGYSVYARSITYLFVIALSETLKGAKAVVHHAINNEIYGEISYDRPVTEEDISKIKEKMLEIVKADDKIEKVTVTKKEAEEIFKSYDYDDKLSLLKNADEYDNIKLYKCREVYDYFYGPMVPSMGHLNVFDIMYLKPGFLILLPEKNEINKIPPFKKLPKLRSVYKETKEWARILDISNLGSINERISNNNIKDTILIGEALHEKKISKIADNIAEKKDDIKIVLIAGPSSSGKTTFSNRLSIQLKVLGLQPHNISADDYFVDRKDTPIGEDGEPDFESIKSVDVRLLNEHLTQLLNGEEVQTVRYNFITGQREFTGESYKMEDNSIIIVEGIHGLNENLTISVPKQKKYKIYVSALTQLSIDNHNSLFVSDVRTIRRIIRDNRSRGNDAETTLLTWPSVRAGEESNIFPYQEEADVMFNSTIVYEMSILKKYAEPLLEKIGKTSPAFTDASRILKQLRFFKGIEVEDKYIPPNSIIREFIGGSCFE